MIEQITSADALISLFYVILIVVLIQFLAPKSEANHNRFFKAFFLSKILYGIVFVLIHSYYYKGGDTFLYFAGGRFFYDQLIANPGSTIDLLFSSFETLRNIVVTNNTGIYYALSSQDVYLMSRILGVLNLLTGSHYLASTIIFTLLTATGIWQLYKSLCELYPPIYKYLAIGILFYPSLGIWGSGILKDPLTFAAIGFLFRGALNLIRFEKILISILYMSLSTAVCFVLKPYILYTFIPILLLWVQSAYLRKTQNTFLKLFLTPFLLVVFGVGGFFGLQQISAGAGKYSLENVQSVAEGFQSWHTYLAETRDQSGYSLGEVDFTLSGILAKAPQAFFVSYFRPFIIGDVRNVATLFEALQALTLLIISIYVFLKVGILKSLRLIFTNADLRAFMLFAVVFGVTVGLTSYNFGALSRYKIPGVPFYVASIAIIYYLGYLKPKKEY